MSTNVNVATELPRLHLPILLLRRISMIDQSAHGHALDLIAARRGLRGAVRALLPYADPRLRVSFAADPLLSDWDQPNAATIPDPVRVAVLGIVDDALDDASH